MSKHVVHPIDYGVLLLLLTSYRNKFSDFYLYKVALKPDTKHNILIVCAVTVFNRLKV